MLKLDMGIRFFFMALLILIFSGGCCRLAEKMLETPDNLQGGDNDASVRPAYYGIKLLPELQPPDMYGLDAPETTVVIEDNEVYGNNRGGIRIRGSLPVHISRCNFHHNGRAGIRADVHSRVFIDQSGIFNNSTGGVNVEAAELFACRNTRIFQNGDGGVRVRADSEQHRAPVIVDIRDSRIYLNRQGGINVRSGTDGSTVVTLADNAVFGNARAGIRVEDDTSLTAWNNTFFSNGTAGIASVSSSGRIPVMDIFQNRIFFNRGAGLFVQSGRTGSYGISNNWIYNNYRAGIGCGLEAGSSGGGVRLAVFHNTIVANGSGAVGAGIRDDSGGVVVIRNNIIAYNFRTGIMVGNCNDACYNLLFANGENSRFDEDQDSAFLLERMQYAGCPGRGTGDVIADPLFSDPDNYDFSLKPGSPALQAGEEIDTPYFSWFGQNDMGALLVPALMPGIGLDPAGAGEGR